MGGPGALLDTSWSGLGRVWGPSWARLGRSWGAFGGSVGLFFSLLGALGRVLWQYLLNAAFLIDFCMICDDFAKIFQFLDGFQRFCGSDPYLNEVLSRSRCIFAIFCLQIS